MVQGSVLNMVDQFDNQRQRPHHHHNQHHNHNSHLGQSQHHHHHHPHQQQQQHYQACQQPLHQHHQELHQQHQNQQQQLLGTNHDKKTRIRKTKRIRTTFTPEQLKVLEHEFAIQMYLVGDYREVLAQSLGLSEGQVKVWFQNRRIKHRKLLQQQGLQA